MSDESRPFFGLPFLPLPCSFGRETARKPTQKARFAFRVQLQNPWKKGSKTLKLKEGPKKAKATKFKNSKLHGTPAGGNKREVGVKAHGPLWGRAFEWVQLESNNGSSGSCRNACLGDKKMVEASYPDQKTSLTYKRFKTIIFQQLRFGRRNSSKRSFFPGDFGVPKSLQNSKNISQGVIFVIMSYRPPTPPTLYLNNAYMWAKSEPPSSSIPWSFPKHQGLSCTL